MLKKSRGKFLISTKSNCFSESFSMELGDFAEIRSPGNIDAMFAEIINDPWVAVTCGLLADP